MSVKVLIASAKGEAEQAETLARPIRAAGHQVAHEGTVIVGDSGVAEVGKLLAEGGPVVLCGTVRAMGTKWARQVVNAARAHPGVRLFVVQTHKWLVLRDLLVAYSGVRCTQCRLIPMRRNTAIAYCALRPSCSRCAA